MSGTEAASANGRDPEKLDRGVPHSDADDELSPSKGKDEGESPFAIWRRSNSTSAGPLHKDPSSDADPDADDLAGSDGEDSPEGPASLQPHATSTSIHSTTSSRHRVGTLSTTLSRLRSRAPNATNEFTHPLAHTPTGRDVLVDFDGPDDPYRPTNWPFKKKVITTFMYGFTTCWITFASAIYSSGVRQIQQEFQVNEITAIAGISMVVFGFGLGPLLWAPLSEVYGRKAATLTVSLLGFLHSIS